MENKQTVDLKKVVENELSKNGGNAELSSATVTLLGVLNHYKKYCGRQVEIYPGAGIKEQTSAKDSYDGVLKDFGYVTFLNSEPTLVFAFESNNMQGDVFIRIAELDGLTVELTEEDLLDEAIQEAKRSDVEDE